MTNLEQVAMAIGRVVTRGEVEPRKGWLKAASAAVEAIVGLDAEAIARTLWASRCAYFGEPVSDMPEDERAEYLRHQAQSVLTFLAVP